MPMMMMMIMMMKAILPLFCDGLSSKDLITQLVLLPTLHPDHCDDYDDDKEQDDDDDDLDLDDSSQ